MSFSLSYADQAWFLGNAALMLASHASNPWYNIAAGLASALDSYSYAGRWRGYGPGEVL